MASRRQLNEAQLTLLLVCGQSPSAGVPQSQVAARLALSPAHVSARLEQLRARGLLHSHRCKTDRRRQLWRLTPAGTALVGSVLAELAEWAAPLERRLGEQRLAFLATVVQQLNSAMRDRAKGSPAGTPSRQRIDRPNDAGPRTPHAFGVSTGSSDPEEKRRIAS